MSLLLLSLRLWSGYPILRDMPVSRPTRLYANPFYMTAVSKTMPGLFQCKMSLKAYRYRTEDDPERAGYNSTARLGRSRYQRHRFSRRYTLWEV